MNWQLKMWDGKKSLGDFSIELMDGREISEHFVSVHAVLSVRSTKMGEQIPLWIFRK
jgi:hypothetical protein